MPFKKIKKLFPRYKAHPQQAGFMRRGFAFLFDALIIGIISSLFYAGFSEVRAFIRQEKSPTSKIVQEIKSGGHLIMDINQGPKLDQAKVPAGNGKRQEYLKILKNKISPEDYETAMTFSEDELIYRYWPVLSEEFPETIKEDFPGENRQSSAKKEVDPAYRIIKEYIISLLYFVLFFRLKGQTPGKKIFRLRVIDLEGKPRLNWYQCFERAHGYVCSGLFLSLGFWQVLWHKNGLTMHDKIADTTVIKLPGRPKKQKSLKPNKSDKKGETEGNS